MALGQALLEIGALRTLEVDVLSADVLQVPASALFRDGDGWAVFAVEEGRAVRRRVETGQRTGLVAQVLGGLKEGDRVVVHPDDRLRDGVKVSGR